MRILIGGDHAGFELKRALISHLESSGHDVKDFGPHMLDEADDYPDYCAPLAEALGRGEGERGILIGGSGQGEAMVANRVKGVRAAVFYGASLDIARLSREHNDANILSLGARFLTEAEAIEAVDVWLSTSFSQEERHIRRIRKIDA